MAGRPTQTLRRTVGVLGNFAFGYADVAEGIYFTLGLVILFAGPAAVYAYLFATVAYILTALCYAELSSTYREAGGAYIFARRAFGKRVGFMAAWALLLDYLVTTAISALAAVGYVGYFLPPLHTSLLAGIATVILILGLVGLNIVGLAESAKFSYILAVFDVVGEAAVLIIGFALSYKPNLNPIQFGTAPTVPSFLYAVTIAMSSYLGIEVISQSAGETKRAGKNIPRAVFMVSAVVVVATLAFSSLALGVVHYQDFANNPTSIYDPVSFIAQHLQYGWVLGGVTAILGISVLLVAANAGIIGISRIGFAMSNDGAIPRVFGKLHRKYRTPFVSVVVFSLIAMAVAFSGQLGVAAELYNFGALIAYMVVGLSLIVLRNNDRSLVRPYTNPISIRVPIPRNRRQDTAGATNYYTVPLVAVACIAADFVIWVLVVLLHPLGRIVGTMWMGIGLLVFYLYSRKRGSGSPSDASPDAAPEAAPEAHEPA